MSALTPARPAPQHKLTRKERKTLAKAQAAEAKAELQAQIAARKEYVADAFQPWLEASREGKELDVSDLNEFVGLWNELSGFERRELEKGIRKAMQAGGRDDVSKLSWWRNATAERTLKVLAGEKVPMKKSDVEAGIAAMDERLGELATLRDGLEARRAALTPDDRQLLATVQAEHASLTRERDQLAVFRAQLDTLPKTGIFQDTRFNLELSLNAGILVEAGTSVGIDIQPADGTRGRSVEPFITARGKAVLPTAKGVLGTKHRGVEKGLAVPLVKVSKNNPIQGDRATFSPVLASVSASNTGLLGVAMDLPVPLPLPPFLTYPFLRMGLSLMVSDPRLSKVSEKAAKLINKLNAGLAKAGHAIASGAKRLRPFGDGGIGQHTPEELEAAAKEYFAVAKQHAPEYAQMRNGAWQQLPGFENTQGPVSRAHAYATRIQELAEAKLELDPTRKTGGTSFKHAVTFSTPSLGEESANFKYDLDAFKRQEAQTRVALAIDTPVTPVVRRTFELDGKTYDGWMKAHVPGSGTLSSNPREWTRDQIREVLVQAVFSELLGDYDTKGNQWVAVGGHAIDLDIDCATLSSTHVDADLTRHTKQAACTPPSQNLLYNGYVRGHVAIDDADFGAMFDAVERIQAIDESAFRAMLSDAVTDPAELEKFVGSRAHLHTKIVGLVEDLKTEKLVREDHSLGFVPRSRLAVKDTKLKSFTWFAETPAADGINEVLQRRAGNSVPPPAVEE